MTFSDYVAIIALGMSGLALFISWRQYVRDQSYLKIDVQIEKDLVKAVNQGRRPLTIVQAEARVSSG